METALSLADLKNNQTEALKSFIIDFKQTMMFKNIIERLLFWFKYDGLPTAISKGKKYAEVSANPSRFTVSHWIAERDDLKKLILHSAMETLNAEIDSQGFTVFSAERADNPFMIRFSWN